MSLEKNKKIRLNRLKTSESNKNPKKQENGPRLYSTRKQREREIEKQISIAFIDSNTK